MHALTGERLLAACDQGLGEHPLLRAVTLLGAAMPECDRAQLKRLPIVERDCLLLRLRQLSFGAILEGYAHCAYCGEAMEFGLAVNDALDGIAQAQTPPTVEWIENGEALHLRQTNTDDLLASLQSANDDEAQEQLLARCLGFEAMSNEAMERVALPSVRERFEQLHAPNELRCAMCCPHCAREESWNLDVPHLLWLEARHAARRLLTDIHTIALHYGWGEAAIAGMSQQRRDTYLELLGA